ncbi:alpha/beta hydrolase family esterase [Massilia sp. TSP1-1-2]|uniref:alpha/beta hydrolase family esterase n=1 Tax=Massilia sp. TSP1-1-2 TaxID=2804649 RepID=UPI003CE763F1
MRVRTKAAFLFASLLGWQAAHAATISNHDLVRPEGVRHFRVLQPDGLAPTLRPVVILLHGHGASAAWMLGQESFGAFRSQDWAKLAESRKVMLIAPDGTNASNGKQAWNDCRADATTNAPVDDAGFLSVLIDRAIAEFGADPRRIYLFGTSNGGRMAYRAGIELGPRLAAIGVQSSLMAARSSCKAPTPPLPVFITHGTADKIAPYGGAVTAFGLTGRGSGLSVDESVAVWRTLAALADAPVSYRYPHLQAGDPTSATRLTWGADPAQLQMELLRIDGGGHTGSSRTEDLTWLLRKLLGEMNHDGNTPEAAWRFFEHKRVQAVKPQ